eukprot:gene6667-7420_t
MAAKSETSWEDPQHSNAKRVILKKFLQAYIPIMCEAFHKINIVDCFAGPGKFFQESKQEEQDEEVALPPKEKGSPLVALDAGIEYFQSPRGRKKAKKQEMQIHFYFSEAKKDRLESLKQNVCENLNAQNVKYSQDTKNSDIQAKFNIRQIFIHFYESKFESLQMDEIMCRDWPTFFFIDPFGYSQILFDTVSSLCKWERSEILINLMIQPIQRAIGKANLLEYNNNQGSKNITAVLGTDEWGNEVVDGKTDFDKIAEIYSDKLMENQMNYTLRFTMKNNQNVSLYSLIYATKHLKGIKTMKESMNRVTQEEDQLSFSSFSINKRLIEWKGWKNNQDEEKAAEQIYARFQGQTILTKTDDDDVYEESIEGFILLKTLFVFRAKQVKNLFNKGKVKINFNFGSNRGTFKKGEVAFMAENERFQLPEFVKLLNKNCKKEKDLCNLSKNVHSFECINRIFKHTALSVDARDGSEVKLDKYLEEGSVKEQISCNRSNSDNHKEGCVITFNLGMEQRA